MPDFLVTNRGHAERVAAMIQADPASSQTTSGGFWHWINGVASGIGHLFEHNFVWGFKATYGHLRDLVDSVGEIFSALHRLEVRIHYVIWYVLKGWAVRQFHIVKCMIRAQGRYLIRLIYVTTRTVLALAFDAVRRERKQRISSIARAEAKARREIKALHHTIEREAASGYRVELDARASLITKLLEYAVVRDPALKFVVGESVRLLLDLLAVDDPPARLLLGFLMRKVVNHLGIDKAVGHLIDDLLAPLIGEPKPHGLHGVILDLSQRMLAVEAQWTQFFTDGGAQVEQAGRDWRNITGPIGSVAIVAFTAQAVTHPEAWAREINDTIGVAANDLADAAIRLFRR